MPFKSKKAQAAAENIAKRWKEQENIVQEEIVSISADDDYNKGCQTNSERFRSLQTQTYIKPSNTIDQFDFDNVSDIIDVLIDSCQKWNSTNQRILSLIIYLTVRLCKIQFEEARSILLKLNLLSIQTCHSWLKTIIDEDDLCVILRNERGKYKRELFYELYPELKFQAKLFAMENASQKKCSFIVKDLAFFINKQFYFLYGDTFNKEIDNKQKLIRSEESCRVDLLKWVAKWDKNKNRPYFEGNEREDVIANRNNFVNFFLNIKINITMGIKMRLTIRLLIFLFVKGAFY